MKKIPRIMGKNQIYMILAVSGVFALGIFLANTLFLKDAVGDVIYTIIDLIAFSVLLLPAGIYQYEKYKGVREIEEKFPDFLRNIVEGLRGGMTLPLSVTYASRNYYGSMDPYIRRLAAQISWGVPFEAALKNFSDELKSKIITRSVSTINEAHRSGGNIVDVLDSVTKSTVEIDKIRLERESRISSQMMTGYIIFFVFIGVMVGLREFLLPALKWGGVSQGGDEWIAPSNTAMVNSEVYGTMFLNLAIIQGLFSGIAIGKLAYGSIGAGVKHSVIMSSVGYGSLVLAHAIFS